MCVPTTAGSWLGIGSKVALSSERNAKKSSMSSPVESAMELLITTGAISVDVDVVIDSTATWPESSVDVAVVVLLVVVVAGEEVVDADLGALAFLLRFFFFDLLRLRPCCAVSLD